MASAADFGAPLTEPGGKIAAPISAQEVPEINYVKDVFRAISRNCRSPGLYKHLIDNNLPNLAMLLGPYAIVNVFKIHKIYYITENEDGTYGVCEIDHEKNKDKPRTAYRGRGRGRGNYRGRGRGRFVTPAQTPTHSLSSDQVWSA